MTPSTASGFRAKTTKEQRLDHALDAAGEKPLEEYVRRRRGAGQSWTDIAFGLRSLTDIAVTEQALRRWLGSIID